MTNKVSNRNKEAKIEALKNDKLIIHNFDHDQRLFNTLICGDALTNLKSMKTDSVDLIVTDPPFDYEHTLDNCGRRLHKLYKKQRKHPTSTSLSLRIHKMKKMYGIKRMSNGFDKRVLKEFIRVLRKPNLYIWCNKHQINSLIRFFKQFGCFYTILEWHKTNKRIGGEYTYFDDTEYCIYFHKDIGIHGHQRDTYFISSTNRQGNRKYDHPTVKPLWIINRLIKNSSHPGQVVLDPFMGSGTTGASCRLLHRSFYGFDNNPSFFDTAYHRINGYDAIHNALVDTRNGLRSSIQAEENESMRRLARYELDPYGIKDIH